MRAAAQAEPVSGWKVFRHYPGDGAVAMAWLVHQDIFPSVASVASRGRCMALQVRGAAAGQRPVLVVGWQAGFSDAELQEDVADAGRRRGSIVLWGGDTNTQRGMPSCPLRPGRASQHASRRRQRRLGRRPQGSGFRDTSGVGRQVRQRAVRARVAQTGGTCLRVRPGRPVACSVLAHAGRTHSCWRWRTCKSAVGTRCGVFARWPCRAFRRMATPLA